MPRLNERDAAARAGRSLPAGVDAGDFSEALARGLRVIEAFGPERRRMTVAEAARAVGLPRATVRRTLATLAHLGYLEVDGRSFALTPRVMRLAGAYLSANTGSAILQPACERLARAVREVCSVAVLDGDDAVMIARAAPGEMAGEGPAIGMGIGRRLPALHSSLGRVLLAALDDTQLDRFLRQAAPRALTPHTVTDPAALRRAIRRVRADGYAYVDQEAMSGYRSVAVPLRRWDGRPVAALNAGTSSRAEPEMVGPVLAALRQAAADLDGQLI